MTKSFVWRASTALSPLVFLIASTAPAWAREAPAKVAAPVAVNPQSDAAKAWNFAASDVPVDPNIIFGVLPSGMKYALLKNSTPKDSVVLRMRFAVGSFAEADDQRGLAHFLEHMAFNGSTNVPEGEMIKLLERKGLAFGADTNASTGFDETIYKLDLPNASDDLIDTGLMLMRETGGNLTIDPAAVDRERGIILSERRARDTYQLRSLIDQLDFQMKGMNVANRIPVGTEEVIRTAPASRLRDLYDRYYRPERATLVMVGDFDPAAVEAKIKARFADWKGIGPAGADPEIGNVDYQRAAAADDFVDPAIQDSVTIASFKPWVDEPDTKAKRARKLAEDVGEAIVSRRLAKIALNEDSPILTGYFSDAEGWKTFDQITVGAVAKEGAWKEALALAEQEQRRAVEHGFTQAEVDEQLANRRTALKNAVAGVTTRRSDGLADALISAAEGDFVLVRPETSQTLFEAAASSLTAVAVTAAFQKRMDGLSAPLARVTAKKPLEGGTEAILASLRASTQVAVAAPAEAANAAFAYDSFGTPGKIVGDERVDDLGIRRIRFANNVMLNIKTTDFQKDKVMLSLRVDGGNLLATRDDPTKVSLAGSMVLGGLEAHSVDELRSVLAGKTVSPSFGAGTDAFGGSALTSPEDFALQAKLLAAFLTHPGYRPDGLALIRRVLPQQYAANDATPAAVLGRDVGGILANDDPRSQTPPLEKLMALDWAQLKPVVADSFAHGAIEVGVVGDINEQAAIDAIAATFGALPERRAAFDPRTDARIRQFATDRSERTLIHKGPAEQAELRVYWPARDDSDLAEAMQLTLLSRAMQLMLTEELREKLGESYSPGAAASLSDEFPGYGHLFAASNVDYKDLATTRAAIFAIAKELRDKPVDPDLLDRARKPLLEAMVKSRRENAYWLNYVAEATSHADRLDRSRKGIGVVEAATSAELQALAKRYLVDDKALVIKAVSDKAGK
ncbi:peptidase M16 [Sphingopyxis sp. Root214]|uniref:M16 family metallopeptidase n=1 Tax=unclassified Sphingopyxis TaxID=2614943 RepID=UPI0006F904D4|nr:MULTISPECIES: M16 family metallopeptidase [unclassified Sphingopyxis]KQZ77181.1 peptidase M16 [Sphingopyxis sp. Root154]KRC08933.1 peptidase M16 [Sphingopyxis sp. Root214]